MPVPSVISEGNAKGAARTHAHTQKRVRRQNRPSMASTAAEGPPGAPAQPHRCPVILTEPFPAMTTRVMAPFRTKELTWG